LTREEYEMTEVVRQERESGILSIATYIRNQLLNPKRNSFMIPTATTDTMHSEVKDVVDIFLQENPDLSLTKSVIINYSNRSALDFNLQVRERIFKDKMQLEPRDILLINQNNYNYRC
jgi:exodeoxyribonuclease-5